MNRFSPTMSTLVAAATVNGTEAMTNCVKAYERSGEARMECLREAKTDLETWLADLNKAIEAEAARVPA